MFSSMCVDVQVYESKLQELQKQVETRSLIAETPDEEELEEEEEEEGAYLRSEVHFSPPTLHPVGFHIYRCLFMYIFPVQSLNLWNFQMVCSQPELRLFDI